MIVPWTTMKYINNKCQYMLISAPKHCQKSKRGRNTCLSRMECRIPSHIIMYIYISIHTICIYVYMYIHIHHTTFLLWCPHGNVPGAVFCQSLAPDLRDSKQVRQIFRCSRLPDNLPITNFAKTQPIFWLPMYNMKGGGNPWTDLN